MIWPSLVLTGVPEALADIDARLMALHTEIARDLDWFGRSTTDQMVAEHTFRNRSFRLETSIRYKTYAWRGDGWRVDVVAGEWYASQVEFGHANARPYPFFWPVIFSWAPLLEDRMQGTLERTLGGGPQP
jgi:hypothetical protein